MVLAQGLLAGKDAHGSKMPKSKDDVGAYSLHVTWTACAAMLQAITVSHWLVAERHSFEFRWNGNNGPRPTDLEGPQNLLKACPKTLKRFVFVTSAGVERQKEFPWAILNTFGGCRAAGSGAHACT